MLQCVRPYNASNAFLILRKHSVRRQTYQRFLYLGEHFARGQRREIELTSPVPLAGRKYLASSDTPGFPRFLSGPRDDYPLFLKVQNGQGASIEQWAERSRDIIDEAYKKYKEDGTAVAVLFRKLPINTLEDFTKWLKGLKFDYVPYVEPTGLTPQISEYVRMGSGDSAKYTIEPHNENAYMSKYSKIFTVYVFQKARRGGETGIVDNREIATKLDPGFVEKCEKKQIRYWQHLPDEKSDHPSKAYKSWQRQFATNDQQVVEENLKSRGYSFEWESRNLFTWKNLSPFICHPKTNERLWFNQLAVNHCSYLQAMPLFNDTSLPNKEYSFHSTFGDGEEIEQDLIDEVRRVKWQSAVGFEWQKGDVLFMDNLIMQHSRLSFEGERKVWISLLNY